MSSAGHPRSRTRPSIASRPPTTGTSPKQAGPRSLSPEGGFSFHFSSASVLPELRVGIGRKERIKAEQAHAETQKLTEQNKQIAIKTVQSFIAGGGPIISELSDLTNYYNSLENLLTTADVPIDERNKILGRTKP